MREKQKSLEVELSGFDFSAEIICYTQNSGAGRRSDSRTGLSGLQLTSCVVSGYLLNHPVSLFLNLQNGADGGSQRNQVEDDEIG